MNPYDPPFWFDNDIPGSFSTLGADGVTIPVHKGTGAADGQLLVFQHQNADPVSRVQVVDVTVPAATPTTTTLAVTGGKKAGQELTLTATVAPAEATGTVTFLDGQTEIGSSAVTAGKATAKVKLGAGAHSLSATFTPDSGLYAPSTSAVVPVDIKKSSSTTALTLSKNSAPFGTVTTATVVVTGASAAPTGTVEIKEKGKVLGSGELVVNGLKGTATIALPADLAAGTHQLTAVYAGSADVTGSQTPAVVPGDPRDDEGDAVGGLVDRGQGREGEGHRRALGRSGADRVGDVHGGSAAGGHRAARQRHRHGDPAGGAAVGRRDRVLHRERRLPADGRRAHADRAALSLRLL